MNKYFYLLNWTLLFALLLIIFRIAPAVGTHALTWGAFVGNMMTGGLISWKYNHLGEDAKKFFEEHFFQKEYGVEVLAQLIVFTLSLLAAIFIWRGLYFFVGIFAMWFLNILVESAYAYCKSHRQQ